MTWDPSQYLRYCGPRARPGHDLMARVPNFAPACVYDLGCGPGTLTAALARRWPDAAVTGIDSSPAMLARAREAFPGMVWRQADIADWRPESPPGLIYSNATLHWLDNHETLFPRLMGALAPGGVLAVQTPRNFDQPSHVLMRQLAAAAAGDRPAPIDLRKAPVAEPRTYYELLAPLAADLDIWETEYLHLLDGDDPVFEWTKGTALRPVLDALDGAAQARFIDAYKAALRVAYPPGPDGQTPFPFRRLFVVATRARG